MYIMISAVLIGVFVLSGATILGRYILDNSENSGIGTYQMVQVDEKNIVVLDTRTGQYWKKPIVENSSVKETDNKYA